MDIEHLGHACLRVHHDGDTILLDPGVFSPGLVEQLGTSTGPGAVLVTHAHPDHLDPDLVPLLERVVGPGGVLAEAGAAQVVREAGGSVTELVVGAEHRLGGVTVQVVGGRHAVIHPDVPRIGNVGLLLRAGGVTLFHPGDSYETTPDGVDVLALPLNAPWAKVAETVEFVRAVGPRVVLPVHDALLQPERREVYLAHVRNLGGAAVHDPARDGVLHA
ncbi:MBL fold metallo-hydrolase [Jannaschia sp. R86511]|uniref:MBL fold metallo-hydrolase n=1 Tax=Jannaschia sp. R86511 TaxID=3093853 RepID=UPI0036D2D4F4